MRELSRIIGIGLPSISAHLKELVRLGFIVREKKGIYPTFRANREEDLFKLYKKQNIILRIYETGLVDYIYDSCLPDNIILFGSASKGEDIKESDVDLFVGCGEKKLNLEKYEKMINRKINLFFEKDFLKLSKELKNNILNGVLLKGYIKVF